MIELYVDGASAGNPGKSGIGIFIKGEGHNVKISESIEPTNNHTAEFIALLRGMEEVAKLTRWHCFCTFRFTSRRNGC